MERDLLGLRGGASRPRPSASLTDIESLARRLRAEALEISTKSGYATGARAYVAFCTLLYNADLAPSPDKFSNFIAYETQSVSASTASAYLTGARAFFRDSYPTWDECRTHSLVQVTLRGAIKHQKNAVRRKFALRPSHLQIFIDIAARSLLYDDILFATLLSFAFYGCHRIGEVVWPNQVAHRIEAKVIRRRSVVFSTTPSRLSTPPTPIVNYRLPYHKGDALYKGTICALASQTVADPVLLIHNYLTIRDRAFGEGGALFITKKGDIPTRSWFEKHFFAIMSKDFGGHSCRAGGATFYSSCGLSPETIQALGRWSSNTWTIYIRENPAVRLAIELSHIARLRNE